MTIQAEVRLDMQNKQSIKDEAPWENYLENPDLPHVIT